jgi:hypothetical protein
VIEEENCRVKTYQGAVKSLKELQEFAIQWNESDKFSVKFTSRDFHFHS